jgi:hypothetical protein
VKVIYLKNGPLDNYRKVVEDDVTQVVFVEAPDQVYQEVPGKINGGEPVFEPVDTSPKKKTVRDKTKPLDKPIVDLVLEDDKDKKSSLAAGLDK